MDCKMYASIHLIRSAQGQETDAQADKQELEDIQAYREVLEDVK